VDKYNRYPHLPKDSSIQPFFYWYLALVMVQSLHLKHTSMKLKIICLGKLKEGYFRDAENEYLKRLGPFAKIDIVELKEEKFSSPNEKEKITKTETEKVLKHLPEQAFVLALHEYAPQKTSKEFSEFLQKKTSSGQEVVFIIGGPLGLHESLLKKANQQISFSKMTFPHQMIRIILLEQIYRSITIAKNKQYHY